MQRRFVPEVTRKPTIEQIAKQLGRDRKRVAHHLTKAGAKHNAVAA